MAGSNQVPVLENKKDTHSLGPRIPERRRGLRLVFRPDNDTAGRRGCVVADRTAGSHIGSGAVLGEPARLRRWVAMGIGICGALLIIRPGFQSFVTGYWFVLFSLTCIAGSRLITKHLTQSEEPALIGAWLALLQVPITFVLAIYYWTWPNLTQLAMMIIVGLLVGGAHYTLTTAYERAEVGSLEPFNFLRLVIAALIGYFIFSESPDTWTWIGGVVIIASTTYIAYREAVRRREDTG